MIEMTLVEVRTENLGNNVLILKENNGNKHIPIWIGQTEANAISLGKNGITTARPLTHQLILDIISALGSEILSIHLTHFSDGIYYAELVLPDNITVSVRPSDAMALAVRADIPVFASEALLNEVGIVFDGFIDDDDTEQQVEKFKNFLQNITPEDFK